MGRITISIPDDLEGRLDEYARERQQPVSHVVAAALSAFLNGGNPPSPSPPADDARVQRIEDYLALLGVQVEGIRRYVEEAEFWERDKPPGGYNQPLPPALSRPPWRRMAENTDSES